MFYRYLECVEKNTPPDKPLIIDVKYNAVHNFNAVSHSPLSMPLLLNMLNELDITIIQLVREMKFCLRNSKAYLIRNAQSICERFGR